MKIRICTTCGKEYKYCPNCKDYAHLPKWHFAWCCEECKDLFDAVVKCNVKHTPIEEVKVVLDKYNVKDFSKYKNDEIRKFLEENFGEK